MNNISRPDKEKLLILGATAGEITLIERARSMGIYVIATDYNHDFSFSPAKYVADETWEISWSDTDALEKKCRECGVTGITAGYSEIRIESLINLCKRLNLPCYSTMEQLEITRDKIKFKNMCRQCNVPVVKEYANPQDVDEYPVIVKPVDRAGSIGISIATNSKELEKACAYALEESISKQIIIEKFIANDTKIDFYYAIEDGKISLITSCDTINAQDNGYERVVQSSWLYPSKKRDIILEKVDPALRCMIKTMGIEYGCIFFSGFVDKNDDVVFFECGFRLEGGHQYNYVELKGPYNYLDLFISHALTGKTDSLEKTIEDNSLLAVTINLYAKKGTVTEICGVDEISVMDDCCLASIQCRIGQECHDDKAILDKIGMFQFTSHSAVKLRQDVEKMYELFKVYDENGNDMIYDRIDTSLIENWWDDSNVNISVKDSDISYEEIQNLLNESHKQNAEKGLIYATANQSVEELISKIGNGVCFVATTVEQGERKLVGTCTVEGRKLNYWYTGGNEQEVLLIKLLGVNSGYKGKGIGNLLIKACIEYAENNNYKIAIADSAEENIALKNLVLKNGFHIVDCCKYVSNSFISTVYAKWINDDCPWTDEICMENYNKKRNGVIIEKI